MDLIFTSFFRKKKHPQLGDPHILGVGPDGHVIEDISYLSPWISSVKNLDVSGVVFHDHELTDLPRNITGVSVEDTQWSNNDARFFHYLEYLKSIDVSNVESVWMTDGSDVKVVKNPRGLLSFDKKLYFCEDSKRLSDIRFLDFIRVNNLPDLFYFTSNVNYLKFINMGVIGGKTDEVIRFLEHFCKVRYEIGHPEINADLFVGPYCAYLNYDTEDLLIGEPVTSKFKQFEKRNDVYFIHK